MKKTIYLALVLLIPAFVSGSGNLTLWAGYSYSLLDGANNELESIYGGYSPRGARQQLHAGLTAGMDGSYWYYSWWGIGARLAFTKLASASVSGEEGIFGAEVSMNGSLCQVMAGVPLLIEFFDGVFSAGGGIYAGWGYAAISAVKTGGTPGTAGEARAGAHCFIFEVPLRMTYHISSSFLLDINASYKWADAGLPGVYYTGGGYASVYGAGDTLGYRADFSGLMVGLGFNWRFSSKDWPWYEKKWSWTE